MPSAAAAEAAVAAVEAALPDHLAGGPLSASTPFIAADYLAAGAAAAAAAGAPCTPSGADADTVLAEEFSTLAAATRSEEVSARPLRVPASDPSSYGARRWLLRHHGVLPACSRSAVPVLPAPAAGDREGEEARGRGAAVCALARRPWFGGPSATILHFNAASNCKPHH